MSIALASFVFFAVSVIGTPGPANMVLMAAGAKFGFKSSLPFVFGVCIGKQLIIWPIGFGLLEAASGAPLVFSLLKWVSAGYMIWLAWRVANMRFQVKEDIEKVPGFIAGLLVHPFNPKAWALITTSFTAFTYDNSPVFQTTLIMAVIILIIQIIFHPLWTMGGVKIAQYFAGTWLEKYLMWTLGAITLLTVLSVLVAGEL